MCKVPVLPAKNPNYAYISDTDVFGPLSDTKGVRAVDGGTGDIEQENGICLFNSLSSCRFVAFKRHIAEMHL